MNWDLEAYVALIAAASALLGAQLLGLLARRHDRQQAARAMLLDPAHEFAASALSALAALRHVTPPRAERNSRRTHRNETLLRDLETRQARIDQCRAAIDSVRQTRAGVRLAFHPKSCAAEYSRRVLGNLRQCLETAEHYYASYDASPDQRDWRKAEGERLRKEYKDQRVLVYEDMDRFFDDVALRIKSPTWNPRLIPTAERVADPRWSGY